MQDSKTAVTKGHTLENRDNLAPSFLNYILGRYEGTRLGRQELAGDRRVYIPDVVERVRGYRGDAAEDGATVERCCREARRGDGEPQRRRTPVEERENVSRLLVLDHAHGRDVV